jgi:PAS domain-containing protein
MNVNELKIIIDNIPLLLLIVNSEREVREVNDNILEFTGRDKKQLLGLKGGEALQCAFNDEDPKGCGCMIKHTVLESFKNNEAYKRINTQLVTKEKTYHVILHTTPIEMSNEKLVLVCLEDISDKKDFDAMKNKLISAIKKAEETLKSIS